MTIQKKPLYTASDLDGFDVERQLGRPGEYPFTRGIHPTMYRGKLWTMRNSPASAARSTRTGRYKFRSSTARRACRSPSTFRR